MRLVVTGGGTGGHIYPAIAVANEMRILAPKTQVLYMGTQNGMERELAQKEGFPFFPVRSSGVMRKSPAVAAKGILSASLGVSDALKGLRRFGPDVVFGTGGYASGPVMLASRLIRIPGAIQEQNAMPGKTNLMLSRLVKKVFCAFEYTEQFFPEGTNTVVTGNPIRKSLFGSTKEQGRAYFGFDTKSKVILIFGGSRGAKSLALAGIHMAQTLIPGASLLMVTGKQYYHWVVEELGATPESGIDGAKTGNIIIRPYVHNMAEAYSAADLLVGRAGGMTLSEVTALGLPSVLIPSPNVANNEQEHNAKALLQAGAAVIVKEGPDTSKDAADAAFSIVSNEVESVRMRNAALRIGKPTAAQDICKGLFELARMGQ